jgi:hypothetical protein
MTNNNQSTTTQTNAIDASMDNNAAVNTTGTNASNMVETGANNQYENAVAVGLNHNNTNPNATNAGVGNMQNSAQNSMQGGAQSSVQGGAQNSMQGGAQNSVQGGAQNSMQGGAQNSVGGAQNSVQGGAQNSVQGGTQNSVQGGAQAGGQGNAQGSKRVAIEQNLEPIQQYLQQQGYQCEQLNQQNASAQGYSAIIISGADRNLMGIENATTQAPVINADGMTPQDVAQRLQQFQ